MPIVSVIILSYNRPALLRRALASVLAQSFDGVEVIVVDNASPASEEVARVVGEQAGVKLIRNGANLGYAGGMNRGIECASGRYVYLTEDDIRLDRDCVRHLLDHMEASPETGGCSPVMYNEAAGTIRCAGGALHLGGVYRRETFGEGERDTGQYARPFEVTYVDGAVIFARAEFLRSLGGFREEFFMYVEAVEFSARVAKAGRKMFVVPAAKVYHFEPAAGAGPRADLEFHKHKNLYSLYLLHAPARVLPEFFLRYGLVVPLRTLSARRSMAWPLLKAWGWLLLRAPSLVRERRAGAPLRAL